MARTRAESISFVIPVLDEEHTLAPLQRSIIEVTAALGLPFEIIFVDDGSADGSVEVMRKLCAESPATRLIVLAGHRGKAAALDAGFRHARGGIVITLDADLQDDPLEIPRFLEKIREGYDLVAGWRVDRQDRWHKTISSKLYNALVGWLCGLRLHDINCGFKAYTRRTIENLSVYGELHRLIPVMAADAGAKVTEIPVRHHPRRCGRSKYGASRLLMGFFDLLTVLLTTRYLGRPLHFFGSLGLASLGVGGAMLAYLAVEWILGHRPIGNRPLLFYGVLLVVVGVQVFSLGLLAELILRLGHRRESPPVLLRIGFDDEEESGEVAPPS
jgi:glycosyltransferase involved in cell wall biosynthesis